MEECGARGVLDGIPHRCKLPPHGTDTPHRCNHGRSWTGRDERAIETTGGHRAPRLPYKDE